MARYEQKTSAQSNKNPGSPLQAGEHARNHNCPREATRRALQVFFAAYISKQRSNELEIPDSAVSRYYKGLKRRHTYTSIKRWIYVQPNLSRTAIIETSNKVHMQLNRCTQCYSAPYHKYLGPKTNTSIGIRDSLLYSELFIHSSHVDFAQKCPSPCPKPTQSHKQCP